MAYPSIKIKPKRIESLSRRHPWIFSGALHSPSQEMEDGDVVEVVGPGKKVLATGHYSNGSIAVRVLAFGQVQVDGAFYKDRLQNALELRRRLELVDSAETNGFRLVHGEGDQLPGLVIDIYKDVAVIQAHSHGMQRDAVFIEDALREVFDGKLRQVVLKSAENANERSEFDGESTVDILENGHAFRVNYHTGQKTGFFLDQRDNRELLGKFAKGKRILNAFSYSGGFSVYALKAGAEEVHSLDSSQKAIDLVEENIQLNGLSTDNHKCITADALGYLHSDEAREANYDIVVLDPPAFAKHRSARHRAIQAYKRINRDAFKLLKPGGILFTFSCSQVVTPDLFYNTVAAASIEAGRHIRVLHQMSQPADHPVSIFHPEGSYLKGLVLSID